MHLRLEGVPKSEPSKRKTPSTQEVETQMVKNVRSVLKKFHTQVVRVYLY